MPRLNRALAAAIAMTALVACSTNPSAPGRLEGTAWRAENIDGQPIADDRQPSTLRFFDRQLAGGSLGCNAYSTTYFADSAGLRFGEIAPTREVCPDPVMEQEARFSAALRSTNHSHLDDKGALVLFDATGTPRVRLLPMTP
jgi:heat shock protein HslJ